MSESSDKTTPQDTPPGGGPRLRPMKPDDPHRLGKDEVLVFVAPPERSRQAS
jgi:hypothetical protein